MNIYRLFITCLFLLSLSQVSIAQVKKAVGESFLKPLEVKITPAERYAPYKELCQKLPRGVSCPKIVTNPGTHGGGVLNEGPIITTGYKNVHVAMYVKKIENVPIEGGGVETVANSDDDLEIIFWETDSLDSDEQKGTSSASWLPSPGEILDVNDFDTDSSSGLLIYEALSYGTCDSLSEFEISHFAKITEGSYTSNDVIGSFAAVHDSSINSTGYYNMWYKLRARDSHGGVSEFIVTGTVNVLCTSLNSL